MTGRPPSILPDEEPIERTIRAITVVDETVPSVGGSIAPVAPDPPGTGYAVGRLLGKGGEGQVFEAVQRSFGRQVAVKRLNDSEPAINQLRRFRAEAAITAMLEHPAIIPVHDLCLDEHGNPQLVMKRVSGKTWRALLNGEAGPLKRPLTGEEHVEVLLKVCDAVAFAHSRGILHRDLKPDNVMVGEHGEVLVMDWGCAAHLGPHPPHPDIPVLTELRNVSGTPAYLSPEQARAEHATCGPWSDVYLLGAVLYRMLTGAPPHRGKTISDTIAVAARAGVPRDPVAAGFKVPVELARIAVDAMHPDPAKRLRSAADFAQATRRYLEHREVHRLLSEAERQHVQAKAGGQDSDDAYRRAISAVEQAVSLWPEHVPARRMVIDVGLDSARHAIAAGAFRIARRQAQAAAAEAERLGDGPAVDTAQRVMSLADLRERQTRTREAKLLAMRKLAVGGGMVAGLAMLVGLLAVMRESSNTSQALAEAKTNLTQAESERTARIEGERLASPALLAQARELSIAGQLDEALPLVLAAQAFAPDDAAPWLMAGQILAAQGKRNDAVIALDRSLAKQEDADARELRELCAQPPADANARIAGVLVRMGAGTMAGALNLASAQRVAMVQQQLLAVWPKVPARYIQGLPDGTLAVRLRRYEQSITSLEPLRGLPISRLELLDQSALHDLSPLASLPLKAFTLTGCAVVDFSPLASLPLQQLSVSGGGFTKLSMLRKMPLEILNLSVPGVSDLSPLAGLPLRELRLSDCDAVQDLTPLKGMQLQAIELDASDKSSLLLTDLSPLAGMPLGEVSLVQQRGISDLRPILGPGLRSLNISESGVDDLRPLRSTKVETLGLSPRLVRQGLSDLSRISSLRAINGLAIADFLHWADLERRIVAVNPAYTWNGKPVYKDGKLVELSLPNGMVSLEPLRDLPLRVLDMPYCGDVDLAPIASATIEGLDLRYGKVHDLTPLARCSKLRRLNLYAVRVADLRPLVKLPLLQRLTFQSTSVKEGMAELRAMSSLQQIGIHSNRLMPAAEFWAAYDRGELK